MERDGILKEKNKVFLLNFLALTSILFFVFLGIYISLMGFIPNNTSDFHFHYSLINGNCFEGYSQETCEKYPRAFHFFFGGISEISKTIGSFFGKSTELIQTEWYFFILATTMILLWGSVVFYWAFDFWPTLIFLVSGLPYVFIYNATYPQFLALLWFVLFFKIFYVDKSENWILGMFFVACAVFIHSKLILLFGLFTFFWVLKFMYQKYKEAYFFTFLNPKGILQMLLAFILLYIPVGALWIGVKQIIKEKKIELGLFLIALFLLSINDFRVMLMGLPIMFYYAGKYLETATIKFQKTFLVVSVFLFLLNLVFWANQIVLSSSEGVLSFTIA